MWSKTLMLVLGIILHQHTAIALWSCTSNADCSTTIGAVCSAGDCVCPLGQQLVSGGTRCADASPYFTSPCYNDFQCSHLFTSFECRGANSNTAGNCFCQPGFHFLLGRCWKSVDMGGSCNRNEECMGALRNPFSMSCQNGVCGCSQGYYQRQRGECRKIGYAVGDGCVLDEDCQFTNGVCDLTTFTCATNSTDSSTAAPPSSRTPEPAQSTFSNVTARSLTRQHGAVCDAVNTCSSPFICSAFGTCVCPRGYYASANGASCLAHLGSPSTAEQCVGFLATIIDGICTCPPNIYFDQNMKDCVKATLQLSDSCVSDEMCYTFGAASRCTAPQLPWGLRNCECVPELAVWDEARTMCRLFVGIGERCQTSSDCLAGDMEIECVINSEGEGYCTCPEGYVAFEGFCLTSGLQLGDACQATQECTETEHTVCEAGRCSCSEGYQEVNGICAPTLGGTCTLDADCTIDNSVCVTTNTTSTCQCGPVFVEYNDQCWPVISSSTSECAVSGQCRALLGEASQCVDKQCQCIENYHYRDGVCWPKIDLFGSCSRTSECYLSDISERVVCRNSLCQCSFDYPYSEQLHTCTSSAPTVTASILTLLLALYNFMLSY